MQSQPTPIHFDALEPRVVLDSSFASVGLAYAETLFDGLAVTAFNTEGTLFDSGSVSGDLWSADNGGRDRDSAIRYDSVTRNFDGRALRDPDRGFNDDYAETNGTQFLDSEGFGLGWWYGSTGDSRQELEYLVELGSGVTAEDFEGTWRFSMTMVNYSNGAITTIVGRLTIDENQVSWTTTLGFAPRRSSDIDNISSTGIVETDEGERFYLNADKDVIVFADLDLDDDIAFVGTAILAESPDDAEDVAGGYLVGWAYTGSTGGDNGIFYEQTYLDLQENGEYELHDLDRWDSGDRDNPFETGDWGVSSNIVRLQLDGANIERRMYIGTDAQHLLGYEFDNSNARNGFVGVGVRAEPENVTPPGPTPGPGGQLVFAVPGINTVGREAVYELRADGNWYTSDVTIETGAPSITGGFVSWTDPVDGRAYAAAITNQGLILYRAEVNDVWSFRNLTTEITGAIAPASTASSTLEYMISPDNRVHLIATAADGDVLRYFHDGSTTESGEQGYRFQNITEDDLKPAGATLPEFSGPLEAYATSWGGLNIAGIDTNGDIWSVWWSPGRARWASTNLTNSLGAEKLVGGLTVFLSSWDAINIAGVNTSGNLVATWWVPTGDRQWRQVDLTASIGAPQLTAESVSSFVAPWGAMNVVGADVDTGEVLAYWWSPARTGQGWTFTSLSNAVPASSPALVRDLSGSAQSDNSLNVFGYDADDDLVRYFWYSGQGWQSQNVTDLAIDAAPPTAT